MNQQPPSRQQPYTQQQGDQPVQARHPNPQPKKPRAMSTQVKVTLISTIGTIVVAIITAILAPVIIQRISSGATPTPTAIPQLTISPTLVPSSTPIPNPYPPYRGQLVLNDPLKDNGRGYNWDNGVSTTYGNCNFEQDNTYHVFSIRNYYHRCAAENTSYSNFTFEITLKILKGYCGGMIFRADAQSLSYYYFTICQNGTYNFAIYTTGSGKLIQNAVNNSNIHGGLGQMNIIAVTAINDSISLYTNNNSQAIYTLSDSTFSQGQIGLVAESDGDVPTDISFSNALVWAS